MRPIVCDSISDDELVDFNRTLTLTRLAMHDSSTKVNWFTGSANLTVCVKFVSDQPLLLWLRKFGNFSTKCTITWLIFHGISNCDD